VIPSGVDLAVDASDASLLGELLNVWEAKRSRNRVRTLYYDGAAPLKDFGISLPPAMRSIESALGWIAKGVHAVTDRSRFEGFVSRDGSDDPFALDQILDDNRFLVEFPAAVVSSAVHGCSFLTVSQGDVASGEPEVLVLPRAADDSAGLWDNRRRAVRGFLSVVAVNDAGQPTEMIMYTPEKALTFTRVSQSWRVDARRNPLGEVAVSPLVYRYELKRPFGHSRITRAAMGFADSALRTIVRAEVSAEFYSAPEYYLFGANVQNFIGDDRWSALMGRIKALDVEDGDDKPELHRFTGASPQPHADQLRMWANLFADDQDLEVKFADASNPSSADAIFAAKEDLITKTREANVSWGYGAVKAMQLAVRLRDGLDSTPDLRGLSAQFTDPAIVSPGARADAFSKLATAIPGFAESEVGLEAAGLGREQIIRLQADRRRSQGAARVAEIVASARGAVNVVSGQSGGSAAGGSVGVGAVGAGGSSGGMGVSGP
jgi:uncharacterized membrane protein YgcG